MTTIAWDGKTIAADRQRTLHERSVSASKLHVHDGKVICFTGDTATGARLIAWYRDGADPSDFPKFDRGDSFARLIVAARGRLFYYDDSPLPITAEDPIFAFGSGGDYALGAMAHGASACRAVEIACRFDINSGLGVDVEAL